MKVMWITAMGLSEDIINGDMSSVNGSGGWIGSTLFWLRENPMIEKMAIITIQPSYQNEIFTKDKLVVYKLRGKTVCLFEQNSLYQSIQDAIFKEEPDIIDVQGIEFEFSDYVSKMNGIKSPIIYTLQGLVSETNSAYKKIRGLGKLLLQRSWFDVKRGKGDLEKLFMLHIRGRKSIEILKRASYVTGRTAWDKEVALNYNPELHYYHVDRILRPEFYECETWNLSHIRRCSIYVPQVSTLLKGGHLLLDIVSLLKEKYPELMVWIPGEAIDKKETNQLRGYEKYLLKKIEKKGLKEYIKFTGSLNATQIAKILTYTNVFLQTSFLENSSNALAEAQILGVPCVASSVGGTPTYIKNRETGILFESGNAAEAAKAIEMVFENDTIALQLSNNARNKALWRQDRKRNIQALVNTYHDVIQAIRQ